MTPLRATGCKALRAAACVVTLLVTIAGPSRADAAGTGSGDAATLRARFDSLRNELGRSPFLRPLHMESIEVPDGVAGEAYAVVSHPYEEVAAALSTPSQWCDLLMLHLNTKHCRPSTGIRGAVLQVDIGKKHDQPLADTYRVDFVYGVAARTAEFLQVRLVADAGPLSTRNYRIVLEAVPAPAGRTFIRLSYSYSYGTVGRLAMQAYLGTIGRNKVGFTVVGLESDGQPLYIGGMRGVVERNTMRYYLAIEAYLGARSAPPQARVETSLRDWFAAVERYPRQLHELEQGEYLAMKRREYAR